MVRINYQREKRRKDLDRQRKQEEKLARKLSKDTAPADPGTLLAAPEDHDAPVPEEPSDPSA